MPLPLITQAFDYAYGLINKLLSDGGYNQAPQVLCIRRRFTTAEVNAGANLLPGIVGFGWRLVDAVVIAVGGAGTTLTAFVIQGTQAAATVTLDSVAQAALTQSTVNRIGAANNAVLADGASFAKCDSGTGLTVAKTGAAMTVATAIDVILHVVPEADA